jgi:hypothetical protein
MQIHRANPFQPPLNPATLPKAAGSSSSTSNSAASTPAPAPAADDPPSFLANFHSAMASGPSTTAPSQPPVATVPAMPSPTYSGGSGYFDSSAADARTQAANAMLTAVGSNDLKGYQQAAANFLAASPAGSGLPVWAATITLDQKGNLINTNCAGIAPDGTVVSDNRMGYAGMMNPVPGVPNIADGTANYLGVVSHATT